MDGKVSLFHSIGIRAIPNPSQIPHHSRSGEYSIILSPHNAVAHRQRSNSDGNPKAKSDIDTVNGLWKGLGYYSRAARLLSGAKIVVEELGGCLPNNAKEMESKIPGIGRYSAGAICSIAYNQRAPVVSFFLYTKRSQSETSCG